MNDDDDKKEMWHRLTKEYLTTAQKLDIIREYNIHLSDTEFDKAVRMLTEYIDKDKKGKSIF